MAEAAFPVSDLTKSLTLKIRLTGVRTFAVRMKIGGFAASIATLRFRIIVISCIRALEKMCRVTTTSPVARMANKERGPVTSSEKKRNTVSGALSSLNGVWSPFNYDDSVSIFANATCPPPALTCWALAGSLVNAVPKGLNFLRGKLRRVYSVSSHFSLLNRLIWSGSSDCFRSPAGRLYF